MSHIKTYARIRPTQRQYDDYEVTPNRIYVRVPEHVTSATLWGGKTRQKVVVNHEFKFDQVFREHSTQQEVFNKVAVSTVEGFLNGYNGTIFAYGQTGSGKTFTVEGGAQRYEDRGLAPRALSMIYRALESRTDEDIQVKVSYMEIYQEIGYDLLSTATRSNSFVVPFPKVAVVEGSKGSCIIRNLSMHLAANEDVAQNLLFQGQTNRKVGETPMNQRSSRSHAVFTIYLTAKNPDSDIVVKSKLHLVDLAGSERVSKTGTTGLQLNEAKFINLSLHHLESVIIALQKEANGLGAKQARPFSTTSFDYKLYNRERLHKSLRYSPYGDSVWRWVNSVRPSTSLGYNNPKYIPYRNSLLTMVLRDSLGGNCQTAMVATISMEPINLCESLSTCRFAQRVACITNTLRKNEEIDDKSMIRRLRKRIAELESQLSGLRSGEFEDGNTTSDGWGTDSKLTDEDKLHCANIVEAYLAGRLKDPVMAGITNPLKFRECLKLLRTMVKEGGENGGRPSSAPTKPCSPPDLPFTPSGRVQNAWTDDHNEQQIQRNPAVYQSSESSVAKPVRANSETSLRSQSTLVDNQSVSYPHADDSQNQDRPGSHLKDDVLGSRVSVQTASTLIEKYVNKPSGRPESSSSLRSSQQHPARASNAVSEFQSAQNNRKPNHCDPENSSQQHRHQPVLSSYGKNEPGSNSKAPLKILTKEMKKNQRMSAMPQGVPVKSGPVNGRQNQYKSPFERKREQEIRKLDKKLEKGGEVIRGQQEDIQILQNDIRFQKLILLQKEVCGKLDKTKQQILEQQSYVTRLKEADATSNILEQEILVEKQLQKRQHKMQKRLEIIEQQISQHNNQPKTESKPKETGDLNIQNYGARHIASTQGKVNSRAVLEMLQLQEKHQTKMVSKLEKEKIATLSQHVEMKEVATRQKLKEFREKLKQSQTKELSFASSSDMSTTTLDSCSRTSLKSESDCSFAAHGEEQHALSKEHGAPGSPKQFAVTPFLYDQDPFHDLHPPTFTHSQDTASKNSPFSSSSTSSFYAGSKAINDSMKRPVVAKSAKSTEFSVQQSQAGPHTPSHDQSDNHEEPCDSGAVNQQASKQRSSPNLATDSTASFSKLLSESQSRTATDKSDLLRKMLEKQRSHTHQTTHRKAVSAWNRPYTGDALRPPTKGALNMGSASSFSDIHNTRLEFTTPVREAGYEDLPSTRWINGNESQVLKLNGEGPNSDSMLPGYFSESVRQNSKHHSLSPSLSSETSKFSKGLEPKLAKEATKGTGIEPKTSILESKSVHSTFKNSSIMTSSQPSSQNATDNAKLSERLLQDQNISYKNSRESFESRLSDEFPGRPRTSTKDSDQSMPSFEKYLPTEYINQDHEDSFDARKMGLKRNNFDEALEKMLSLDPTQPASTNKMTISHSEYNEFARDPMTKSKTVPVSKHGDQSHPLKKSTVSTEKGPSGHAERKVGEISIHRTTVSKDRDTKRLWGPEAKFVSISDRLEGFAVPNKPEGRSLDDSDVLRSKSLVRNTEETTEGIDGEWKKNLAKSKPKPQLDLDRFKIKIKALDENSREEVYVSTARQHRDRIQKIRRARNAAEVIQTAWRNYRKKSKDLKAEKT